MIDLQSELDQSQKESRASTAEVLRLKVQLEEAQETNEAVRKENKNLTGE